MIKLMRLDERFIHGQVAFAWTNSLGADCISLKIAAPAGIKFIAKTIEQAKEILNGDKIKKYKVFLIVDNTKDALELIKSCRDIKQLNLGNMKMKEDRKAITSSICISQEDIDNIKQIELLDVEVECRAIPTDKKLRVSEIL